MVLGEGAAVELRCGRGAGHQRASPGPPSAHRFVYQARQHSECSHVWPVASVPNGTIIAPDRSPSPQWVSSLIRHRFLLSKEPASHEVHGSVYVQLRLDRTSAPVFGSSV